MDRVFLLLVRDSFFSGNRGGIDIDGNPVGGWAGGLWINESALDLENTTFHDNQPNGLSVGLYSGAAAEVRNATFVDSKISSNINAYNSLFVGVSCGTSLGAHNIQYPPSGTCPPDTVSIDPRLADPADNGGPTPTMMPAADSPIDIGSDCPATDQRGEPRPADRCDAGAVER